MTKEHMSNDEHKAKARKKPEANETAKQPAEGPTAHLPGLAGVHEHVGNRAIQRLVQRSGEGPAELDDETAARINRERGGGQSLDGRSQEQMGAAMGQDFSDVRVHTSSEADDLNEQLSARAFTTGKDIFFRDGAYDPHSSGGQELIAHELTHVAQQRSGAVDSGGTMTVNAPGDSFEQQADGVAKAVTGPAAASGVQRQEEADAALQMQPMEEEEEEVQAQEEEEEEEVQAQAEAEEEEEVA